MMWTCTRALRTHGGRDGGCDANLEGSRLVLREERVEVGGGDVAGSARPLVPETTVNVVLWLEMQAGRQ